MSNTVAVLVVASPGWMNPSRYTKMVEGALRDAGSTDHTAASVQAMVAEAVNAQAAITYAALSSIRSRIEAAGDTMVLHVSDLASEVAVRTLWVADGHAAAEPIETSFSKDTNAGFYRVNDTIASVEPFAVVTFSIGRSSLTEHAVAMSVSKGIHANAHEWTLADGLVKRGWITADNIMAFYPPFADSNRWTAWERIQRTNTPVAMTFDLDAIKAAAATYEPNHFDGHVDRCNRCAAPKHKGRCTKAALAAVGATA